MNQRTNEIYEITVVNYPTGGTEVSKAVDPLLDAKILLEGIGVLIPEITKWSKEHPDDLKEKRWDMEKEDVVKLLHEYLDLVSKEYKQTFQTLKFN